MTQNNMNSHVLVRVGAEFLVANMESFRIQIPANVTKHNEFTVFLDTFNDPRSSLTVPIIAKGAPNNTLKCERSPAGQLVGNYASRFSLQMVVVCTDTGSVTFITQLNTYSFVLF